MPSRTPTTASATRTMPASSRTMRTWPGRSPPTFCSAGYEDRGVPLHSDAQGLGRELSQFLLHRLAHLRVGGIEGEVLELVGVLLQIVHLGHALLLGPVDVLPALGAHGLVAHTDDPRPSALAPVLAQERLAPSLRPALHQRHQRAALNGIAGLAAGELDQRRRDVDGQDHLAALRARGDPLRIAHIERRADALLVCEAALDGDPVLTEEEPVVAEEDDAGVVELPGLLERLEQHAHALVYRRHHRGALPDLLLRAAVHGGEDVAR